MKYSATIKSKVLFMLLIIIPLHVLAQDIQQQLRLAREFEQSEKWEEAGAIYEALYRQKPDRLDVFHQYMDYCLRLKEFNRALVLILDWQEKRPNDINLLISEAEVYAKMGNRGKAVQQWRKALDRKPKVLSAYQKVASSMTRERYFEEAEKVYLLARKKLDNDNLFALNLSNLYAAQIKYGKATSELIFHLLQYPKQTSFVENHLRKFPKTKRVQRQVKEQLKKAISANPTKKSLRQVLIHYYLHTEAYKNALDETLIFESFEEPQKKGDALLFFARKSFLNNALQEAESAYLTILKDYPQFKKKNHVLERLAQCYKAQHKLNEAIDTYQQINDAYPRSSLARHAIYQIAMIQKDHLFHFSEAEKTFQKIINQWPKSPESASSQIHMGECTIALGEIGKAEQIFQKMKELEEKNHGKHWIHALVNLAEILYLKGDFSGAISKLDQLSAETVTDEAMQDPRLNDGLTRRLFLNEHAFTSPGALLLFARSEYLYRQRKMNEALSVLDSLCIVWQDDLIIPHVLFKKGELGIELDLSRMSIQSYETLLNRFPHHLLADQALERTGWIREKEGNKKEAIRIYESLLMQYPNSLLANEVRERMRLIKNGERM